MGSLLTEIGRRITDRWLTLLLLPGALLVGTVIVAVTLGHRHGVELPLLVDTIDNRTRALANRPAAVVVLTLAAVLAATAAGLLNQALAALLELIWLRDWPGPLGRLTVTWRQRRWRAADEEYEAARNRESVRERQADLDRLSARRNRISLEPPTRPTWVGDRIAAADSRIWNQYRIDLTSAWPRLWLLIPDSTRTVVTGVRGRFDSAAVLTAWATQYAVLAFLWWPAALIALVTFAAGWRRGRTAATALAEIAEAIVDLHGHDLAAALHIPASSDHPISHQVGIQITEQLRKGT